MKRELWYYEPGGAPNYTRKKMVKKREPANRLVDWESTHTRESTQSNNSPKRGNATPRTLAMGPCDQPKRRSTTENQANI